MENEDFQPIGAQVETTNAGTMEMESLCPECHENGTTRMMLTKIPFFREVIISSFECFNENCMERNSFVQFGGSYQPSGCLYSLTPKDEEDLNRSVVRSDRATISIPELEFEIPPRVGEITTVEGLVMAALEGLEKGQVLRRAMQPEVAAQIDAFLLLLRACLRLERPWTLQIRDPTGNSFIENPRAPHPDPHCTVARFQRSAEDDRALGLSAAVQEERAAPPGARTPVPAPDYNTRRTDQEQRQVDDGRVGVGGSLAEVCYACKREGVVNLAMVDIPHFKETVILSFVCEHCGFRSNEVKSGGAVPDTGTEIRLDVREAVDLSRDVLKSDTCTVQIPELDFEMTEGSLGSMFTTVEGLLQQIGQQLRDTSIATFANGDSSAPHRQAQFDGFLEDLEQMRRLEKPFTLRLVDPLGHSYCQSTRDDPADDPRLTMVPFERTAEQDEELGIDALRVQEERAPRQRAAVQRQEAG